MIINGSTRIFTILAHPATKVTAPMVYSHIFAELGLNMAYVAHDVAPADLARTMESFRCWRNLDGFNVTIPHKEGAAKCVDTLCEISQATGVVNTVCRQADGSLHGYNTDGSGALRAIGSVRDCVCLVLGAGGAARAIIAAMLADGASEVLLLNRSRERACQVLEIIGDERLALYTEDRLEEIDVLVQSTPVADAIPFELELDRLQSECRIFEAIMHPTLLAAEAGKRKLELIPGHAMLYYQTGRNFELFTKRELPPEVLRRAFASVGYNHHERLP